MKQFIKNYWAFSIPLVVLIIASLFLFKKTPAEYERAIGMIEASFTDVASEYPGRIDSLLIKEGDTVKKGQLLALIHDSNINSIQTQAEAAVVAAESHYQLIQSGPRSSIVASAKNLEAIAQEQFDLVEKTYNRMNNLYDEGVISGQELDMIQFKYEAARKELETAKLHSNSIEEGSRPETIRAAEAVLQQTQEALNISQNMAGNTKIYAPATGIISTVVVDAGEVISIGYPMITIQKENSLYAQFNLRQDKMKLFFVGDEVKVQVPGAEPEEVSATITSVSPSLTFANWVPQENTGQFEMRTFTIKCKIDEDIRGLRPGMTTALQLPKQ